MGCVLAEKGLFDLAKDIFAQVGGGDAGERRGGGWMAEWGWEVGRGGTVLGLMNDEDGMK